MSDPTCRLRCAMTTRRAIDEADIRRQLDKLVRAIRAMDLESAMSIYASDIVSFDIVAPLRHVGWQAKRKQWLEAFAVYRDPLGYEIHDLQVTVGGDVAFAHSLNRLRGTLRNGSRNECWIRSTACLERI